VEELKEGGADIPVTEENAHEYITLFVTHTFYNGCKEQFDSFKRGFYKSASLETISSFFKPEELEQMVCGSKLLDFDNMLQKTRFRNGFTKECDFIKWFFEILNEFDET
jgi:ubiquitin-protein ligase E3 A